MNYTDINSKTIDQWVEDGWEWGKPIDHETYEKAKQGEMSPEEMQDILSEIEQEIYFD